jgi:hypothetical protein
VITECGVDAVLSDIERRMTELNSQIADDLGNQFRVGHSYVTPTYRRNGFGRPSDLGYEPPNMSDYRHDD